jgi:hypothetical protein
MPTLVRGLAVASVLVLAQACLAAADPGAFPFVIPIREAEPTAVDVSALNPAPLTAGQRLGVRDGHFVDAGGRRVRFLGVSVAAGACFPLKADAELIAARMHKYGINCVRLHHMDAVWSRPGLFYADTTAAGKPQLTLSPESLDRLDYFVYQLQQHGIYVDLNLHVSRPWSKENGFADADQLPAMGKVLAYFEPRAISQQRQTAKDLLTHVNPYSHRRWADEPSLALVELNNEDSLVGSANVLPTLPPAYRDLVASGWNAWLKQRYGTTAGMIAAWSAGAAPPEPLGDSLLANGDLRDGLTAWHKETQGTARYTLTAQPAETAPGAPAGGLLHVGQLQRDGVGWHMQLHQIGLTLEPGKRYTVALMARADQDRPLVMNVRLDVNPWTNLGLDTSLALTPRWKRYTVSFTATVPQPGHCRLSFELGGADADLYLADLSLRRGGGAVALPPDETIEAGNLSLPAIADNAIGRDYVAYLMQIEDAYIAALRQTVRGTGATAAITCSQASYGGLAGQLRESRNDWVDSHAYWQHPQFPGRAWDSGNWRIGDTPMVKDAAGGNLWALARQRVAGKPFTVSEYDHPAPSEYAAEAVPLIFSFAAWQDWDGVFLFDYDNDSPLVERDRISGYFDYVTHPAKLGFFPAAAQILASAMPAAGAATLSVPPDQAPAFTARRAVPWDSATTADGRRPSLDALLGRRMQTRFGGDAVALALDDGAAPSTSSLAWDRAAGVYRFTSPNAAVLVGLLGGRGSTAADALTVTVAPSARNFAAITLVSADGQPLRGSGRLVLTAIDKAEDRDLHWNPEHTFAPDAFRQGPIQVTGVTAEVQLATTARAAVVHALDSRGRRAGEVAVTIVDGQLRFTINPTYRAIWYEIAATR